MFLCIDLVRG